MKALAEQIVDIDGVETYGRVVSMRGLMVEVAGPIHAMSVGARLTIKTGAARIPCEVVGFSGDHALAMPFAALDGVRRDRCRRDPPVRTLAGPGRERSRRADRRFGTIASGVGTLSIPRVAAAGPLPAPGWRSAGSRLARA
jgi:flagellum-specific ATP synthase